MMTTVTALRKIEPGGVRHPGWCSPDHCRADRIGKTHESAPVEVAGLTVSVSQAVMAAGELTHPVVIIENDPNDNESAAVMLRLGEVPAFAKALLSFHCQHA